MKIEVSQGQLKIYALTQEDEEQICPEVWYIPGEIGKLKMKPIKVKITDPDLPIRVRQYPISLEGRRGLKPVIENLLEQGALEPHMPPHNTPILPVKKTDGNYRLVEDLRAVNQRTVTKFPVVANS